MEQWEVEAWQDIEGQLASEAHTVMRFNSRLFVSHSKGRARSRPRPKEIHLVSDLWTRPSRWQEAHTVKWDDKASETYPGMEQWIAERKLIKEVKFSGEGYM